MDRRVNPFSELYLTETIPSSQFIRIFSPTLVNSAEALFLPGNVVLQGVQGSGKTMLLELLSPDLRIAYAEANESFPLKRGHSRFIGCGVNLTRSRAVDFGQRPINLGSVGETEQLALYFGDFVNYLIVADLLRSVRLYSKALDGQIATELGMAVEENRMDSASEQIAASGSWFGYTAGVRSASELEHRLAERIQTYRAFFNFNLAELPRDLQNSKTAIGAPIADAVKVLKKRGIIPEDVHIFVQIDQYEELSKLEGKQSRRAAVYRSIINKALASRDPHISYRIGTRTYAFREENLEVFGTTARLERDRNYKLIDLDKILRRKENASTWIFPKFAEDVFVKRLRFAGYSTNESSVLERVFGNGLSAEDRARTYCGKSPDRAIRIDENWPEGWKQFLKTLVTTNPLSARLAEAWARQKRNQKVVDDMPTEPYPWEGGKSGEKQYWRKERVQTALMQIAGRCAQRIIWAGRDDILGLSGGNILVFLSICQHIWGAWLRTSDDHKRDDNVPPEISDAIQAIGIHEASTHAFEKLREEPEGDKRQRFASYLGNLLEKRLFEDTALSYPGHNGFSLTMEELELDKSVRDFLNDAVDYGALFDALHTTKEKNRKPRKKWYLNPVLSPHFKIPHIHTKEPLYASLTDVRGWIDSAVHKGLTFPDGQTSKQPSTSHAQQSLVFSENERS
jgi:hypothetical protein